MKMKEQETSKLPLMKRAEIAMQQAVRKEIRRRRILGLPIYVIRDGKVVDISRRTPRRVKKQSATNGRRKSVP